MKQHSTRSRWQLAGLFLVTLFLFPGCLMLKSEHLKKMALMQQRLDKKEQEKKALNKQLDTTTAAKKKVENNLSIERKRLIQLKARYDKMTALYKNTQMAYKSCQSNLRDLANKGGRRAQKLRQALEQLEYFKRLARKRKALFDRLTSAFKSMVDSGKLRVSMLNGLLVLQLSENILFASGSASVKKEGKEAIAQVTQLLKKTSQRWQVVGHTDNVGSARGNWRLSMRRALGVLFVMLKSGMPEKSITAAGFGQYHPVAPNDTKENKARNRRTEIVLVPNLQELQKVTSLSRSAQVCLASL